MKVFADTLFWIARTRPGDQWAKTAEDVEHSDPEIQIITSEEVLIEFANAMSSAPSLRLLALRCIATILTSPRVTVLRQSHESFLAGLRLFGCRADKTYSLTDCISMENARDLGISQVLTADRHFEQEGFEILMRR